jgi:hypothetical protein
MVVDFMEGVLWGIVEVAEKAGSEEVAEEAAGGDARESEMRKAKGKKEGERVDEEEVENRSGFRAGARRTQLPADGIDTRITPSSGLSAGPILASHPTFLLAGSPDTNTVHRSNAAEIYHSEDEMEQAFGHNFGFPTNRRPVNYRRPLISPVSEEAEAWLEASGITVRELPQPQAMDVERYLLPRTCDFASHRSDLSPQPHSTRLQASAIKPTVVNGRRGGMAAGAYSSDGQDGHHRSGRFTMECAIQIRAEKEQFVAAYTYILSDKRRHDQIKLSDVTSGADPQ